MDPVKIPPLAATALQAQIARMQQAKQQAALIEQGVLDTINTLAAALNVPTDWRLHADTMEFRPKEQ
jgi:hypothetical protein